MKKTIFSLLVILAAATGTAFAGTPIPSDGTSIGAQGFKTSNNVTLIVASEPGTSLDPGGFSAASRHGSGNRNFAVNHAEPKIFWNDAAALADTDVTCTASDTYTPDVSSWNSL